MSPITNAHSLVHCALFISIGFFNVFAVNAEEEHHRTATIKLTHPIVMDHVGGEASVCMTQAGIDYPVLLQRSLQGDHAAIKLLIWASDNVGLDGAAAEGYSVALVEVAKKIGDEKLVLATADLKMSSYESVRFYFLDQFGSNSPDKKIAATAEENVIKLFPKFWKQMVNNSPQLTPDTLK